MRTQQELARLIEESEKKIHQKVNELHMKYLQRERIEGEIVSMKEEINACENVVHLLTKVKEEDEDRKIMEGLKLAKGKKRGQRTCHKLGCS